MYIINIVYIEYMFDKYVYIYLKTFRSSTAIKYLQQALFYKNNIKKIQPLTNL